MLFHIQKLNLMMPSTCVNFNFKAHSYMSFFFSGHDREKQPVRVLEAAWWRPLWVYLPVRFRTM